MKGNNAVCWYCHNNTMAPAPDLGNGWLHCSKCGATNETNPTTLGAGGLIVEKLQKGDSETHYRPSLRKRAKKPAKVEVMVWP